MIILVQTLHRTLLKKASPEVASDVIQQQDTDDFKEAKKKCHVRTDTQ